MINCFNFISMIHGFDNIIIACGPHCSGKTFNIMGWNRKVRHFIYTREDRNNKEVLNPHNILWNYTSIFFIVVFN